MLRVYYEHHADPAHLRGRRIALVGFGAQGRAQALNLRDSGHDVVVGLRARSPRRKEARADGFRVLDLAEAAQAADLLMLLVPDEVQGEVYRRRIAPHLRAGSALGFSHGMAVHFGLLRPKAELDVFLVAPKGPGGILREQYLRGNGLPALAAVGQDASGRTWELALAYASGIGCARAGVLPTTFEEEAITDLFGEQAVLTGGMAELARLAYETLVERGYSAEVAYIECVQELLGLADLVFREGIAGMRRKVSSPACWGGMRGGREVAGAPARRTMRRLLREVESGRRVRWLTGLSPQRKRKLAQRDGRHDIERVGRLVRKKLRWPSTTGASLRTRRSRKRA